jgi:glycosyltransferase involved in cell wall biosynthesis
LLARLEESNSKRFDETVILPRASKLCPHLEDLGVKYIEIDGCADRSLDIFAILKLWREIRRVRPHILNSHACLSARIAGRLAGVPTVIQTRHSSFPIGRAYDHRAVRAAVRIASRLLSDRIIAVAHIVKRDLLQMGVDPERISVVINGAKPLKMASASEIEATRERLGVARGERIVGICARLEKCKDHETFLRAAEIICRNSRDYRFLIVGEGSQRRALEDLAGRLGIADRVIFTGFCENVAEYMNIFDVNVNCSVGTETSSLALSEGMSLGIPAIASDYGGNPYMVRDGVNGFLYPQGNADELARRILRLEDDALHRRLSLGAYERFYRELNAKRMTCATEELYVELLKKRPDRLRSTR